MLLAAMGMHETWDRKNRSGIGMKARKWMALSVKKCYRVRSEAWKKGVAGFYEPTRWTPWKTTYVAQKRKLERRSSIQLQSNHTSLFSNTETHSFSTSNFTVECLGQTCHLILVRESLTRSSIRSSLIVTTFDSKTLDWWWNECQGL